MAAGLVTYVVLLLRRVDKLCQDRLHNISDSFTDISVWCCQQVNTFWVRNEPSSAIDKNVSLFILEYILIEQCGAVKNN